MATMKATGKLEYPELQAGLSTPEGLHAAYVASYEVVGVTMALAMGFAFDGMGERPEVHEDSLWSDRFAGRPDRGTDLYHASLGLTFTVAFAALFSSAGMYAVLNQTPPAAMGHFIERMGVERIESIHGPQSAGFVLFGISGVLRISLVSDYVVASIVILVMAVTGILGFGFFVRGLQTRQYAMRKLYEERQNARGDAAARGEAGFRETEFGNEGFSGPAGRLQVHPM